MGNHRQPKHRRKRKKCREPQHLTENSHLPLTVVVHFNEDRLCNLRRSSRNQCTRHVVPLEGLCEITHSIGWIKTAKDDCEEVLADSVDNCCDKNLITERKHLANRCKIDSQRRSPRHEQKRFRDSSAQYKASVAKPNSSKHSPSVRG